jgi:hypothetical protein
MLEKLRDSLSDAQSNREEAFGSYAAVQQNSKSSGLHAPAIY